MTVPRVLVIDDNPLNLELASFVLETDGLLVDLAKDATEARQQIDRSRPGLILMDIELPGLDGLALTQPLKADPATAQIVVIAFTAYAMRGDEFRLRAGGCDGYLAKPIDISTLASRVRAFIAGSAQCTSASPAQLGARAQRQLRLARAPNLRCAATARRPGPCRRQHGWCGSAGSGRSTARFGQLPRPRSRSTARSPRLVRASA